MTVAWRMRRRKRIKVSNDEIDLAAGLHIANINQVICGLVVGQQVAVAMKTDHRKLPQSERVARWALVNSREDYTGPTPIFRVAENSRSC
jgi:hypothetical protein